MRGIESLLTIYISYQVLIYYSPVPLCKSMHGAAQKEEKLKPHFLPPPPGSLPVSATVALKWLKTNTLHRPAPRPIVLPEPA